MGNRENKQNKHMKTNKENSETDENKQNKIKIESCINKIKEWIMKQTEEMKGKEEMKEIERVIKEIEYEKDYSKESYEDIRYVLRPFEEIHPLEIKRLLNISMMDQYTMFITTRYFDTIEDHINLVLTTKRYELNITKFHYNPVTSKTRE